MMKFHWLTLGLFLLSNIQPITANAQSTSEQMRYAQQRNHWRSQEIHNDVQNRMAEVRKRLEESRNRMGSGSGSSYNSSSSSSSNHRSNNSYHPNSGSSYAHLNSYGSSDHRPTSSSSTTRAFSMSSARTPLLGDADFNPPKIAEISTYPGHPSYSYATSSPKVEFGTMTGFRFKTTDSPIQVFNFYTKDLQAHGWTFNKEKCRSDYISAEHPKVNRRVTISYKAAEGGGTDVDLDYSQNLNFKSGFDSISNFSKSTNVSNMGNNERVKMNNSAFPGMILPGTNLDNNERIQRGLK